MLVEPVATSGQHLGEASLSGDVPEVRLEVPW